MTKDEAIAAQGKEIDRLCTIGLEREAEIERLQKSNKWLAEKLGDEAIMVGKLRAALVQIGILNASGGNYDAEIDRVIYECAKDKTDPEWLMYASSNEQ